MKPEVGTPGRKTPTPHAEAGRLLRRIRNRAGITQMAATHDVLKSGNLSTFRKLESGERRMTPPQIEKFFRGLGASLEERAELYRLSDRRPERIPRCREALGDPPGLAALMEDCRMQVRRHELPTYLLSGAFEVVEMNEPYREIAQAFPVRPGHELADPLKYPIGFVLKYPDAEEYFLDWMRNWVPPMLSYLKAGMELNPNDPVIAETADAVLAEPRLRRAYDRVSADLDALSNHHVDRLVRVRRADGSRTVMGMRVRMFSVPLLESEAFAMLHVFPYFPTGARAG
ncbi:helix-turn-helix domain-containing protein [Streptomyces sp. MAR4 CNY-716]